MVERIPRPGQVEALMWCLAHERTALYLPMGFGKTFVVLLLRQVLGNPRTLVVAPKTVARDTWPSEIEASGGADYELLTGDIPPAKRLELLARDPELLVMNFAQLQWLTDKRTLAAYRDLSGHTLRPFDLVVIDEVSGFKDTSTKQWKALAGITNSKVAPPKRVVSLTGTPAADNLTDLFGEMLVTDGGATYGKYVTHFRRDYFQPENPYSKFSKWVVKSEAHKKALLDKLSGAAFTADRSELDKLMPPMSRNDIMIHAPDSFFGGLNGYVEFAKNQVYGVLGWEPKRDSLGSIIGRVPVLDPDAIDATTAAALRNKLRQFTAGFIYGDERAAKPIHRLKMEKTQELVGNLRGDPVLLFYAFEWELEQLRRMFPGATAVRDPEYRQEDWDAGRIPVLLAHPLNAAHGLNLQHGGHNILWQTVPESGQQFAQANHRLYRPGQKNPVVVTTMSIAGTIDEVVLRAKDEKAAEEQSLFDHLQRLRDMED